MDDALDIDREIKALVRLVPQALFRLAGINTHGLPIFPADVPVDQPQHDADSVFRVGGDNDPAGWALHLEYQLQPDSRELKRWMFKNAGLSLQLDRPVLLLALYLYRGKRRTFPGEYVVRAGGLETRFTFSAIRLWEHAERIRTGDLAALAPLLVLCEDEPTLETLETERQLIQTTEGFEPHERADLLAIAVGVARKHFTMEALELVFREEETMLLKETSWVREWMHEAEAQGAQEVILALLQSRFGQLPESVVERVRSTDEAWCRSLARRVIDAQSLADLGLE